MYRETQDILEFIALSLSLSLVEDKNKEKTDSAQECITILATQSGRGNSAAIRAAIPVT
jgi:hypothetical protein